MRNLAFVLFAYLVILGGTSAANAQTRQLATEPVGASWVGGEASAQLAVEGVRFAPPAHYTEWQCKMLSSRSGGPPYLACWAIDPSKVASIFLMGSANGLAIIQHSMLVLIKAVRNPLVPIGTERVGEWEVTHYTLGSGYSPHRISIGTRQAGGKNWVLMVYNGSGYPADIHAQARSIFTLAK